MLFIEDTNEHPYRIERMLFQLQHAGVLDQQKTIVFDQFDNYRLALHDRGYDLPIVIERLRRNTLAAARPVPPAPARREYAAGPPR